MVPTTLGQYLVRNNFITEEQLGKTLDQQVQKGGNVLDHLLTFGFLDEGKLISHLAEKFGLQELGDTDLSNSTELLDKIPAHLVLKYDILPIKLSKFALTIATADPFNLTAFNEVKFLTGFNVNLTLAKYSEIKGSSKRTMKIRFPATHSTMKSF